MKKILKFLPALFCVTMLCSCTIKTATYRESENLPKLSADKFSRPLYLTEVKIGDEVQRGVDGIRANLNKNNPQLFTTDAKQGIPATLTARQIKKDTESGTLNTLGLLTLTIFPISSYDNIDYDLELDVCGVKGTCPFQYSFHTIMGLTPLTYIAYPFVGWFAAEKGLSIPDRIAFDSPAMQPFIGAAAEKIDVNKIMSAYAVRPKTNIPDAVKKLTDRKMKPEEELIRKQMMQLQAMEQMKRR